MTQALQNKVTPVTGSGAGIGGLAPTGECIWPCSPAASFVTGHAMVVDGGFVAQ